MEAWQIGVWRGHRCTKQVEVIDLLPGWPAAPCEGNRQRFWGSNRQGSSNITGAGLGVLGSPDQTFQQHGQHIEYRET